MLTVLQVLAFTGCALLGLLPNVEVECRLDVPVAVFASPAPAVPPATESSDADGTLPCLDETHSELR